MRKKKKKNLIQLLTWPDDENQKDIGQLEAANLSIGASAFGLRLFKDAFGWSREKTEVAMVDFRRDSANPTFRQCLTQ